MTSQPEPAAEPIRRKFDDVTSLFGSIVPAPGSPVRPPRPFRPLPVALPEVDPPPPTVVPTPPAEPETVVEQLPVVQAVLPAPTLQPIAPPPPPPPAKPRPAEIPWPDAFEPLPNYRTPKPRNWSWLLLIPIGLLAAVGIGTLDAHAVRSWIDTNILHRSPEPAGSGSLLPNAFRPGYVPPAPVPGISPEAEPPNPTPALPTSPVPPPAGAVVSPPPAAPVPAGSPQAAVHVTIRFRRGIPGADGEARRIAALLQSTGGSVELHPTATTMNVPTITYYNASDKEAAGALAAVLANEAVNWTVKQGSGSFPPGAMDIWMP